MLFGLLLAAHLIGDFPLQPDWMARRKTENIYTLSLHVAIHGFLVIPIAWYFNEGLIILWVLVTHFVIDYRRWFEPKESWDSPVMWVWLNDQILHITALALTPVLLGLV